jgi:chemotaxis protein MotB
MAEKKEAPIIIRRIEEEEDHPPHGGAWKVALADLMTAMMAFFLIMWLIASSDEAELTALADYFTPTNAREQAAGGAGILWGESPGLGGVQGEPSNEQIEGGADRSSGEPVTSQGESYSVNSGTEAPASDEPARFPDEGSDPHQADGELIPEVPAEQIAEGERPVDETGPAPDPERQAELQRILEAQAIRERELERVEDEIRNAVLANNPPDLLENIDFQVTPEGLLVRILDRDRKPIFETGSADFGDRSRALVVAVAGAVAPLDYPIVIAGHTDSAPYRAGASYSNWELSSDRAHSTRRVLLENGVGEGRIARVSGYAETVPLNPEDTRAAENRRVNLLLRYPDPVLGGAEGADRP